MKFCLKKATDVNVFTNAFCKSRESKEELPMEAFDTFEMSDGTETWCFRELREAWTLWNMKTPNQTPQ